MSSKQTPIIIRDVQDGDLTTITDIYNDTVINTTATYELDPLSLSAMSDRLSAIKEAGFPCFVAEESCDFPRVLGYAYASAFRPRPAYRFTVEHSIYVASDSRARGVGSLLMEALIKECERLGFRQIVAVIGDGRSYSPSVLFHKKLGFRYSGRLEGSGYKFGRWLDTTFMQFTINGGIGSSPDPTILPEVGFPGK
ncbi:acyl-CoA N-acyltransferase [Parachaetomium inaequale]|uniref:Acyl-CoA N-acyltransferase n=1 Tax=Parachaetomium inaequale TaxID=2588326 RepID=A0AAN6PHJ5_9PEZI|nr:acyl-CoA N-acyltransferase [Parachaetomium inaequale]